MDRLHLAAEGACCIVSVAIHELLTQLQICSASGLAPLIRVAPLPRGYDSLRFYRGVGRGGGAQLQEAAETRKTIHFNVPLYPLYKHELITISYSCCLREFITQHCCRELGGITACEEIYQWKGVISLYI